MDDEKILELYWNRSEEAISETEKKYGRYLNNIALGILEDVETSRECVNDTLLGAWDSIPPAKPEALKTYLGKITRNLSLTRWRNENAEKRGGGRVAEVIEEMHDLPDLEADTERVLDSIVISDLINRFLSGLKPAHRKVFMKRYWCFMSVREIAENMRMSESNVRVILHRCRNKFKEVCRKEGIVK